MEGLQPLHRRVAGIDVKRMLHLVTVVVEQPDGSIEQTSRAEIEGSGPAAFAILLISGRAQLVLNGMGFHGNV